MRRVCGRLAYFYHRFDSLVGAKEMALKSAVAVVVRVVSAISSMVMSVAAVNYVGSSEAGRFFLVFAVVQFLSAISRCGLDNVVLRYAGIKDENAIHIYGRAVAAKSIVIVSAVAFCTASLVWFFSDPLADLFFKDGSLFILFQLASFGVVGLALCTVFAMALQGLERVASSVFVLNIISNLAVLASLYFGFSQDAESLISVYVFSCFSAALIGYCLFSISSDDSSGGEALAWNKLFESAGPLWMVVILDQLSLWAGQMIAGAYGGTEEVAYLAVAQRVSMVISFALVAVSLVVAPRFSSYFHEGNYEKIKILYQSTTAFLIVCAVPVGCFFIFFPDFVIGFFGEGFESGGRFLQVLVVGQLIYVATGPSGYLLMMSSNERDVRRALLISAPVGLLIAMLVTPFYGAIGCAIGTAVAVALQNIIAAFFVNKRFGFGLL